MTSKRFLRSSVQANSWRRSFNVFIPKAGKNGVVIPIGLTSFMLKRIERALDSFVRKNLARGSIVKAQHAYVKSNSAETDLHAVVSRIANPLENKEYTLGVFNDIEGAFSHATTSAITYWYQQGLKIL